MKKHYREEKIRVWLVSTALLRSSKWRDQQGCLQQLQAFKSLLGRSRHTAADKEALLMVANVLLECLSCTSWSQNQSPAG